MFRRIATATLVVAATSLAFTACSSSSTGSGSSASASASPTASATASASASASESPLGGNVLPPIMVTADQKAAAGQVGDTIVFNVTNPAKTMIATDKPAVLELTQGRTDGSATFNPGAKALTPGIAVVTITEDGGQTREVVVTITPKTS